MAAISLPRHIATSHAHLATAVGPQRADWLSKGERIRRER